MQIERNLKKSQDKNIFVSTLPKTINQKLIDGCRVKLFAKIKDSLEKKKIALEQEQVQFQECLRDKKLPINNNFYTPNLGA